jgi:hypothetical protein
MWNDNSDNEAWFSVVHRAGRWPFQWVEVGRTGLNRRFFTVTGLVPNTTYKLTVEAYTHSTGSGPSDYVDVTTLP